MVDAHDESFRLLEEKLNILLTDYIALKQRNKELVEQLENTTKQLQDALLDIRDGQKKYETLKLAKAFGQSEEDKKRAYRRITKLVNDIDACIKLIKE
ncbi:MAG: hypothetical protein MJZ98_04175 [Paludibacteraceae bacterium]|nr:hypothetical protein [Paludibacteraceae bacterium]